MYGKSILSVQHLNKEFKVLFIVVDSELSPIIGLKTSVHMNLIKRVNAVNSDSKFIAKEFHDLPIRIRTDSSENGLVAFLEQKQ